MAEAGNASFAEEFGKLKERVFKELSGVSLPH
jgi:hypothetical protein